MHHPSPIVFDLFGVLIRKQSSFDQHKLAGLAGAGPPEFSASYWQERPGYDCGCSSDTYWTAVSTSLGLSFDDEQIEKLTRLDNESWANVDPSMVRLLCELRGAGTPLYLLSNIPCALLAFLDARYAWLTDLFEQRFMSCEMGTAKPATSAFDTAFSSIARRHPGETARFVDDSQSNIVAAEALAIPSHRYQELAALRSWLSDPNKAGRSKTE